MLVQRVSITMFDNYIVLATVTIENRYSST